MAGLFANSKPLSSTQVSHSIRIVIDLDLVIHFQKDSHRSTMHVLSLLFRSDAKINSLVISNKSNQLTMKPRQRSDT